MRCVRNDLQFVEVKHFRTLRQFMLVWARCYNHMETLQHIRMAAFFNQWT